MKVYWEYICDYGHRWTLFREENAAARPEDSLCPLGHYAVTLHKSRPLDRVQITLRPAAIIVDDVTGQVRWERRYWFVISSDIENTEERISGKPYLWREVLALAERFQGRSKANLRDHRVLRKYNSRFEKRLDVLECALA